MKRIQYLLLGSLMMFLAACEKDTLPTQFAPSVTTGNATDIYRKGAVLSGSIQLTGTATAKNYGILFSELESMAEFTEYAVTDGSKDFSVSLSALTPGTTYYYCAYAHSGYSIVKGAVKSFSTKESNAPIFSAINLLSKDEVSCKVSASLLDEGGSDIFLSGFCWAKAGEGEPTADSHGQIATIRNGVMSAEITGLEPETDYLVRAYASNSTGVGYSESVRITTDAAQTPILSAITQTGSSNFSVSVEAQIINEGTSAITAVGFCWSTEKQEPNIDDSHIELTEQWKNGKTTLNHTLSELTPNTTYYIRAYATNDVGTTYSEVFTFTTAEAKTPTLSAITQKESSDFSVTIEAEVTDGGTSAVIKAGFCWSTENKEPTVNDTTKELANQLTYENKKMSLSLSELTPGTTYYIRAYATNAFGTTYSTMSTFKTPYKDADNGDTGINNLPTTEWK